MEKLESEFITVMHSLFFLLSLGQRYIVSYHKTMPRHGELVTLMLLKIHLIASLHVSADTTGYTSKCCPIEMGHETSSGLDFSIL